MTFLESNRNTVLTIILIIQFCCFFVEICNKELLELNHLPKNCNENLKSMMGVITWIRFTSFHFSTKGFRRLRTQYDCYTASWLLYYCPIKKRTNYIALTWMWGYSFSFNLGNIPGRPLGGRHGMVFGQISVSSAIGNSITPLVPGSTSY